MIKTVPKNRLTQRIALVIVGVLAATGVMTMTQQAAQASTITVPFQCSFNAPALNAVYDLGISDYAVTMTSPLVVEYGTSFSATYSFPAINPNLPFDITGAQVRAEPKIDVRKQSGSILFAVSSSTGAVSTAATISAGGAISAPGPVSVIVPTTTSTGSTQNFDIGDKLELIPDEFKYVFTATDDANLAGATVDCQPQSTSTYATRTTVNQTPPASPVSSCTAQTAGSTGGAGCATEQVLFASVAGGVLTQRAYTNTTPTSGSTSGATVNANNSATSVNLGTVQTPLTTATVTGHINDIEVTDTRGGTFGWSLTATINNFTGDSGNSLNKSALKATPSCSISTTSNAYDYTQTTPTLLTGFNASLVAPGQSAGSAAQSFAGTVSLCTKNTDENLVSQSTGGLYFVQSTIELTLPPFLAADRYTTTLTITLT